MSDDNDVDVFGNRGPLANGSNGFGLVQNGLPTALSRAYHEASRPLAGQLAQQLDRDELRSYLLDASDPKQGKFQCQLFSLLHLTDHDRETVTSLIISAKSTAEERAELVEAAVRRFAICSKNVADTEPFKQRFRVTGTVGTDPSEAYWSAYAFNVTPPPEVTEGHPQSAGLDGSGGLSLESVVGSQQRIINTLAHQSAQDKDRLVALLVASNEREERIADAREKLWMEREKLRDESADREIRGHREKLEAEAMSDLWKGLRTFGFQWVSQAMSKGNPLAGFSKTLEPTQIMMMLEMMDGTQRKAFEPVLPMLVSGLSPEKKAELNRLVAMRNAAKAAEAAAAAAPKITVVEAADRFRPPAPVVEPVVEVAPETPPDLAPELPPLETSPPVVEVEVSPTTPPPAPAPKSFRPSARVRTKRKK